MEELDPISRIEFFLDAVLNGDPSPYDPQTRAEFYLAYLCGSAVTLPTPQSRVDFYLAYKCGEDVEIPDPIERIDFYLAKWCGYDCETPDPIHPIEYYLNALANNGVVKTVTGNPISVSDALAKPAESLTIEILPYQSGSGDPSPDNVRPISGFTGVNIYHESAYDPDADPTYSISWQDEAGTVYGGELDVTTGVLTVDRAKVDITGSGSSWLKSTSYPGGFYINDVGFNTLYGIRPKQMTPFICSHAKTANNISEYQPGTCYCDGSINIRIMPSGSTPTDWNDYLVAQNANGTPVQVCVTLATPLTIQLTPTEIEMLLGNNVLWNDLNGDMTLEYLADGPADDIDALNILLNNRYVNNGEPDEATDREALEILLGGNTR